ncbi:TonB-dependent receptor domain-containing protein [Paraglaciecola psychrophila]|uniref:TonB-dependent receptor n=1 Tax=Paraglaciecola psychrophila 170 TaxID=1129794 RepID=K7AGF1_9ALTE|nr:TonB-dependent receptor [Paraglaciecola psychrophila]AGH43608.1 TonB-dependent receptor [Paraglaciecola psychrophila 170]GAC39713.1 TonB-dependent receptor [Paraglaciecola psychrophila 170]
MKKQAPMWKKKPILLSILLSFTGNLTVAMEASAQAPENQITVKVEAVTLDDALQSVAKQFGKQIVFFSDIAKGIKAQPFIGLHTEQEALNILLKNTELQFRYINDKTIAIEKIESKKNLKASVKPFSSEQQNASDENSENVSTSNNQNVNANKKVLEKIIVTAQRRTQNLQEVPISVSVIKGDLLDSISANGGDIRFMSARIPSLKIESSFGRSFPRFYMRGLGNQDFDLNASQPVSLIYDGVVQENPILKGFPVFDVESIEALRGPQGTLFGRNTPAGLVKFTSKRPTQDFEGYFTTSIGSLNTWSTQAAISGGITDTVSVRLSLLNQTRDDWIDTKAPGFEQKNILGGYEDRAVKFQVLYEPTENFSALLNYHARDLDGTPTVFRASAIKPGTNDFQAGFDRDVIYHDAAQRATQTVKVDGGSLKMEYVGTDHTYTSVTGYESVEMFSRADVDGGYRVSSFGDPSGYMGELGTVPRFSVESADGIPDHSQITQEFRLASNELGQFDYQAGFFLYAEDLDIDTLQYNEDGNIKRYLTQKQKTDAWALFASGDYDLTEEVKITGGIRYSKDKKDYVAQRIVSTGSDGLFFDPFYANPEDSAVSWDLSASYKYTNDINLYTRMSKGFRAPSIQGRIVSGNNPTLSIADSETIHSIEVGTKSDLLDGAARVNFDVFYFQMNDQQMTAQSSFDEGAAKELLNLDKTVGYGFEVDTEYAVTADLLVSLGLSYNNTEIKDSQVAISTCDFCIVRNTVNEDGLIGVDGLSLPRAPEWIGNFTLRYSKPLGDGEFYVYTDWSYASSVQFSLIDAVEMKQDPYLEGGIRAGYNWYVNEYKLEVAAFGRNITDERSLIGGLTINNLAGIVNDGRFWGAEFKINF